MKRATGNYSVATNTGYISIHALVKRATLMSDYSDGKEKISIHALVKRATDRFRRYCS